MGRDQNDNAVKVQHHGCGIALNPKSGPDKIGNAVQKILNEKSFKQAANSFREDILSNNRGTQVLQELERLVVPVTEKEASPEEVSA
jgi:UDP:flavonoid glycosyltransferase YjiC (YdhE family)